MKLLLNIAVAIVVLVTVLLSSPAFFFSPDLVERGDEAVNALQIERAKQGLELLGPYSRFGFHHPGPVGFYYLALTEPLLAPIPTPYGRHLTAQLALNLVWLILLAGQLSRLGWTVWESRFAAGFVTLQIVAFGGGGLMLARVWGPVMVILPTTLSLVLIAGIAAGDRSRMVMLAVAASFAVHTHGGVAAVLGPLFLVSLVAGLRSRPWASGDGRILSVTGCVVAVMVIPAALDAMRNGGGNMGAIISWVLNREPGLHAWPEVARKLGHSWTDVWIVLLRNFAPVRHHPGWATVLIVASAAGSSLVFFRRNSGRSHLTMILWGAVVLSVAGARTVPDQLYPYLYFYMYGVVGLIAAVGWVELSRFLKKAKRRGLVSAGVVVVMMLVFVIVIGHPTAGAIGDDSLESCRSLMEPEGVVVLHLSRAKPDGELWGHLATLALSLRRAGREVEINESWRGMFGEISDGHPGYGPRIVLTRRRPVSVPVRVVSCDDFQLVAINMSEAAADSAIVAWPLP